MSTQKLIYTKKCNVIDALSFKDKKEYCETISYWKGTKEIHDEMEKNYKRKGGVGEFKNKAVRMKRNDLFKLYHTVSSDKTKLYAAILDALEAINKGYAVYFVEKESNHGQKKTEKTYKEA